MNMAGMAMASEWSVALLAWPAMLAQSLIFGSAILCLMLGRSTANGVDSRDTLGRALAGWWRLFALVVAIMSSLMFVDQVAGMAGVSWRGALPLLGEVLRQTQGGNIWEWRLPATAALPIVAWIPMRAPARALALLILCAALFLGGSLMSHAIDFGAIAIVMSFVHSAAAGAWTGALFGYWIGARSSANKTQLSIEAARALSTLATWSVSILIASGIYLAYEGLGRSLDHLLYSSYGRVLSLKVELFAVVLVVGAYNRLYLIPKIDQPSSRRTLLRNVSAEALMIIGVIGLAALLAATPPARMSMDMSESKKLSRNAKLFISVKPLKGFTLPTVN
jgi:putative copper resistance protein D